MAELDQWINPAEGGNRNSMQYLLSSGTQTAFEFNFAGGYISAADVKAYVYHTATGLITPINPVVLTGPNTIEVVPAVPAGDYLVVYRDTQKTQPLVDFASGAVLNEENLDTVTRQAVFAAAEMVDRFAELKSSNDDAITRSAEAVETANAAKDQSTTAAADAASALSASTTASANSSTALTTANAASATANGIDAKAQTALDNSAAAVSTANGAAVTASGIDAKATQAQSDAANAVTTANAAATTANGVDAKASQALAATNTMGTAATATLATSTTDTTAGRVLRVGDWGIGGTAPAVPGFDLHTLSFGQGLVYVTGAVNGPAGASATAGHVTWRQRIGNYIRVMFMPYNSAEVWFDTYNGTAWLGWRRLMTDADVTTVNPWSARIVGEPFPLLANAPLPPTNDPSYRYVILTAGLTGAGQYNDGILTGETVTGTAPLITAIATISLAGSPLDGTVAHLINTEGRFIGAGVTEAFEDDSMQGHEHTQYYQYTGSEGWSSNGGLNDVRGTTPTTGIVSKSGYGTPRVADHTQPRAARHLHLMRIL